MAPQTRDAVGRGGVGIALWLSVFGLFASFVPGVDVVWWVVAAGSAGLGLLSPSSRVRFVSLVLALILICFAWLSFQDYVRYREWLQQHHLG